MRRILKVFLFNVVLLFAVFLFLSISHEVSAQDTLARVQTKYITLKKIKKDKSMPGSLGFSGVRFIDNRIDTTTIYSRFMDHGIQKHNFRNGLSSMNAYVNSNYRPDFSKSRDSLLIVVNDFRVSEISYSPGSSTLCRFVKVNLLMAAKNKGGVALLGAYDTLLVFPMQAFTTYQAGIKKSLKSILSWAASLSGNPAGADRISPQMFTEKEFANRYSGINTFDYPILRDTLLRKGIYMDYLQFVSNSPRQETDELPGYELNVRDRGNSYDTMTCKLDSAAIWGYCDGKTVYVRSGTAAVFYPLLIRGNHFELSVKVAKPARRDSVHESTAVTILKVAVVIVVVGALCFLVAKSGSSPALGSGSGNNSAIVPPQATVENRKRKYYVSATRIDMQTGKLVF